MSPQRHGGALCPIAYSLPLNEHYYVSHAGVIATSQIDDALAVVCLIRIYAVIFGITLLMLGFRLRGIARDLLMPA